MDVETISSPQRAPSVAPSTAPGEAQASLLSLVLVALATIFVLVRALPILSLPMGNDQGTYLTIGQGLLDGKLLYRDLWDNKPPGIFILYAGIAKLFGRAMWSVAAVDLLLLLAISYLLFRFTERYLGRAGAAIAVMVHASMHGEMMYFWIAQPETFQVVCVLAGYLLLARSGRLWALNSLVAGFLLGYACWLKYNAIAFLPFLAFLPYLDSRALDQQPPRFSLTIPWRDWFAKVAFLLVGLAAAAAIVLAWIVLKGAWPAMREAQFEVLPRYAAMAVQRRPHYLLAAFARTNYWVGEWNLWAALAGLLVAWKRRDLGRFVPIFLAALAAFATVAMQVRFHDYYFQICYPFLAAIWAYLAVSAFEASRALARGFRQRGWRLAAGLVWAVFAQIVFWPLPGEFGRLTMRYEELREWQINPLAFYSNYPRQLPFEHFDREFQTIDYLQRNAKPSDPIYVWSYKCQIYYLTGHRPPTRFVSNLGIISLWSLPSWRAELMRDLGNAKPRFIVVARHDRLPALTYVNLSSDQYLKTFPELESLITNRYRMVADFDAFVVYRRNERSPDAQQGGL